MYLHGDILEQKFSSSSQTDSAQVQHGNGYPAAFEAPLLYPCLMKKIFWASFILLALLLVRDWENRPLEHPPGVIAAAPPSQQLLSQPQSFGFKGYLVTPRARFSLRARVLSRHDYRWGQGADLSPSDLALGWGVMSDQAVLDRIEISQGSRWYFTRYDLPAPIPEGAIIANSSNMHMIPANELVRSGLKKIRQGEVVNATGYLVDVDHDSGFTWRTSLRRDDTGNGSCELFYVERLIIEANPPAM
jgi:hypothetical protein